MVFGNDKCLEVVENICPYCNEHLIMNKRSFANHVRWCKCNPKYDAILESMKEKCSQKSIKYCNERYGEYEEHIVNCDNCGKEIHIKIRSKKFDANKKYYCCKSCASSAHKLTDEQKQKISLGVRKYLLSQNDQYDIFWKKEKICPVCGKQYISKFDTCSKSCGSKYRWFYSKIPIILKKDDIEKIKDIKSIYKRCCQFQFSINEFQDEFDFSIIKKLDGTNQLIEEII